jgi:hypothetical protein
MMIRVTDVDYLGGHKLYLEFSDGTKGNIDFNGLLEGQVFQPLKDVKQFIQFALTDYTLEWNHGVDIAPEYLRDQVLKQRESISA